MVAWRRWWISELGHMCSLACDRQEGTHAKHSSRTHAHINGFIHNNTQTSFAHWAHITHLYIYIYICIYQQQANGYTCGSRAIYWYGSAWKDDIPAIAFEVYLYQSAAHYYLLGLNIPKSTATKVKHLGSAVASFAGVLVTLSLI